MNVHTSISTLTAIRFLAIAAFVGIWWTCQPAGAEPIPFANYGRFVPTGPTTLELLFEPGPFPEQLGGFSPDDPTLPGWDEHVISTFDLGGGPPTVDNATRIATVPILDTQTTIARDAVGNERGRLVVLGVGENKVDLNATNATVDNDAGTIAVQFGGSLLEGQPASEASVVEATGIYQSEAILVGDAFGYAGGHFLLSLDDDPATSLQDNILAAYTGGQIVGLDVAGVWTGEYVPEPSAGLLLASGIPLVAGWRRRRFGRPSRKRPIIWVQCADLLR